MARTVSKTLNDVTRADLQRMEIVPQDGDVLCIVYYQNRDDQGQPFGPARSFSLTLSAGQKTTLINFIDNVVLPGINAEPVVV